MELITKIYGIKVPTITIDTKNGQIGNVAVLPAKGVTCARSDSQGKSFQGRSTAKKSEEKVKAHINNETGSRRALALSPTMYITIKVIIDKTAKKTPSLSNVKPFHTWATSARPATASASPSQT